MTPTASPVAHPLAAPTLSGNLVTVDLALNQPTRITRYISDITLQRFIADRVFSNGGPVSGGAVIYDTVQANELYLNRDVQRVAPGSEFPVVGSDRYAPSVAAVEKWGGKVFITDEARDRNDSVLFTNQLRQLGNTIVRKINQRVMETLTAAVAASGRALAGHNWTTVITGGSSQTNATSWPQADFAKAQLQAEQDELGFTYDLWLLNPIDYSNLAIIYGRPNLDALAAAFGISFYVSNRVPSGTAYVVATGQVGQMRIEKPLSTETWREQETQRTWVQADVRPVFFVDNPFAIVSVTGLQG